ncbi:MAG: hypothetical protein EA001_05735 [Oscillatoriales cyanobacterium]|nr:MAG: hypothetical protein EA001_05735 [Oscillatoriales cyanobacterium]
MQNPEWSSLGDREYTVDIGAWVSRGWAMFQQDIGPFIGFVFVVFGINIVLGLIPVLGSIGSVVIGPVLNAGFFIYAFKILREQSRSFSDFFEGFSQLGDLVLFTIVAGLIASLPILPGAILLGIGGAMSQNGESPSVLILVGGILMLIGLVPSIYLSICYSMGMPLIIDRRVQFWPAMEMSRKVVGKKWGAIFAFSFVLGLINFLGLIPCGLGLLATIPLSMCAITYGYTQIFGLAPKVSMSSDSE